MKLKRLLLLFFVLLLMGTAVGLLLAAFPAQAQNQDIYVDKQLGRSNPVVGVGEYLTFTIFIENRSAFTITTLPLSDTYNTGVLAFADASPPPDSIDAGSGRLDWNDLTTSFGDLAPGASVLVVVGFIAEHPAPAVVNAAEVHDAVSSQGDAGGGGDDSSEGEVIGGSSPVDKRLLAGVVPRVGFPLTFTIRITNDGFVTMTVVPLLENYDPAFLQFESAIPQPDAVDEVSGQLFWSDLTTWLGDVPAQQGIELLVVFTALAPIDVTTNGASVEGAQDWFGNDLAAGADEVPITIVDGPQATATPGTPTATPTPQGGTATSTPQGETATPTVTRSENTSTPFPTGTPAATATPERPEEIAATGIPPRPLVPTGLLLLVIGLLPVAAWVLWRRVRTG